MTTSHAGKMEFPFDNLDQLLEEEASLPQFWFLPYGKRQIQTTKIAKEIEDAVYAYHVYPHMAMVQTGFFGTGTLPRLLRLLYSFDKPTLTDPAEFEALKLK